MRRIAAIAALLLATGAGVAHARVLRAESILPPGQSGFVSVAGLASGTGSPHLTDQNQLFIEFQRKSQMFNQPGETEVPRAGVRIVRDSFGVPAVTGATDYDAWWGAGYAVAQDRLFELELFRRATKGTLAEILGSGFLEDDIVARRDYYTAAERRAMFDRLPARLRERVAAYRDGVNAWIEHVRSNPEDLPGEYAAVNAPLNDWTIDDTLAIGVFLARTVPSDSGEELANLRALKDIGSRAFNRLLPLRVFGTHSSVPREHGLFPSRPGRTPRMELLAYYRNTRPFVARLPLPEPQGEAAARTTALDQLLGERRGSYMVAIRNPRADRAYVFNGPQLGYSIPELFVELEVHAPGLDVRGFTAPGVPVIGLGHNGRVAWGLTSGTSDDDDLFAVETSRGDPEAYTFRGTTRDMECRDEVFRFQTPPSDALSLLDLEPPPVESGQRTERICRTVHGPVEVRADGVAYARRYAIWDREIETLQGISELNDADSIADVDGALAKVTWNENVIAADSQGNIGYWHPGLLPVRSRRYDERLPLPGDGSAEWLGFLPVDRRPHVINPDQGYVTNWNNPPSHGWTEGDAPARNVLDGPFHRQGWWDYLIGVVARRGATFERIETAIYLAGTRAQQRPLAEWRLRRAHRGSSDEARTLLETLLRWDGSYHRTDAAGTVDPGVAAWEEFKTWAARVALFRLGGADALPIAGTLSNSHMFDATNAEAFALRTLGRRGYQLAARIAFDRLAERFGTTDVSAWREPRRPYPVEALGAAATPDLPFFDRGTVEHIVELAP